MSCDICGRGACANWFHALDQQEQFADVIRAADNLRAERRRVHEEADEPAQAIKEAE